MNEHTEVQSLLSCLLPIADTLSRLDRAFLRGFQARIEREGERMRLDGQRLEFLRRLAEEVRRGQLVISVEASSKKSVAPVLGRKSRVPGAAGEALGSVAGD